MAGCSARFSQAPGARYRLSATYNYSPGVKLGLIDDSSQSDQPISVDVSNVGVEIQLLGMAFGSDQQFSVGVIACTVPLTTVFRTLEVELSGLV